MQIATTRTGRALSGGLAAVLLASGASLIVASPAAAATTHVPAASITAFGGAYLGWHDERNAGSNFVDVWNGLKVGDGGDSFILNGLVTNGAEGIDTTAADLQTLITGSNITADGDVLLQVGLEWDGGSPNYAYIRTAASVAGDTVTAATNFVSARQVGTIVPNTVAPLSAFITELAAYDADGLGLWGHGFYASTQSPAAVVKSVTWGGNTSTFGKLVTDIPQSSLVQVPAAQVRPNATPYTGWHEGYSNATPAYSVQANGLHLGDGANSQIINGLAATAIGVDLSSLITSADVNVVSGQVWLQVPVLVGSADTFTTMRPAVAAGAGAASYALADLWELSQPAAGIPANTPTPLGDIIAAFEAAGPVDLLAFGVLAQSSSPSVVHSVLWNGVRYQFAAPAALAATGVENLVAPLAGALLLLAAGGLLMVRRRATV